VADVKLVGTAGSMSGSTSCSMPVSELHPACAMMKNAELAKRRIDLSTMVVRILFSSGMFLPQE